MTTQPQQRTRLEESVESPYTIPPIRHRYSIHDYIKTLDPVRDHGQIGFLMACIDFPWDYTRALEFALFRVFGVAKGTPLLERTGEFIHRTRKRYDDTVLILGEILEHGYDSERGKAALRRMNQQHGRYVIPNDEYLYTLSTFVLEPIRWLERFGWRKVTIAEKQAAFVYWMEIGKRMNIRDLPESLEEFDRFNRAYEREHFRYAPSNQRIAEATRDLVLGMYLPKSLWRIGAPFIYALIDDPLLDAVGFPRPPAWLRRVVEAGLKARGALMKFLPPRRSPYLFTRQKYPSYPNGYQIENLGADRG